MSRNIYKYIYIYIERERERERENRKDHLICIAIVTDIVGWSE